MSKTNTGMAGIDTAKDKLDVAIAGSAERWQFANEPAGWSGLRQLMRRHGVGRIGIEASGGYERGVVEHLRKAGLTVLVLQPVQVRALARYKLRRAKNDRIDAGLIAECTAGAEAHEPPDPRLAPFADLLTFIEQTEEDIARLKVRGEHVRDARLKQILKADLARLATRRAALLARLLAGLRQHDDLARRIELLESIPGIGRRTALALVVRLPELGRGISREQIAALAGLAPFDNDSGQRRGERHIAGGRARPRKSLFAATLPAVFRWNPDLNAVYVRLIGAGKPHKVAMIACARKLLIYANTVLERDTPWVQQAQNR